MKVVIQRVTEASVSIRGNVVGSIGHGLMILHGVEVGDTEEDLEYIHKKIIKLRIFDDANGVMNEDILQQNGDILLVSQFTLLASTKKGNRPSYIQAAPPEVSKPLYEKLGDMLSNDLGKPVQKGIFGEDMQVHLINDGPVTIIIDSKNR